MRLPPLCDELKNQIELKPLVSGVCDYPNVLVNILDNIHEFTYGDKSYDALRAALEGLKEACPGARKPSIPFCSLRQPLTPPPPGWALQPL